MKRAARYIIGLMAILLVASILLLWKHRDQEEARNLLKSEFDADISIQFDEFHIGCSSEKLVNLKEFGQLLSRAGEPTILDLTGAPNLESFEGIEAVPSLVSILAIDCPKLTTARGIADLPELRELFLTDSRNFADASGLSGLPSLHTLDFSGALALQSVDISDLGNLRNLYLSRCRDLTHLQLAHTRFLEQLYVDGCAELTELESLETLVDLTDLDVSNCGKLKHLNGVENLVELIVLDIRNVNLEDFSPIGKLPSLRVLRMGGQDNLENLEPFAGLTGLKEIHLEACPKFRSLKGLPPGVDQYAGFTYCPMLKSLEGIEAAPGIQQLDLTGCENLSDVSQMVKLDQLMQLNLTRCRKVTDVTFLKKFDRLAVVLLGGSGVVPGQVKELQAEMKETVFDFAVLN